MINRLTIPDSPRLAPIPPEIILDRDLSTKAKLVYRLILGGEYEMDERDIQYFDELADSVYWEKYMKPIIEMNKNY